MGTRMHCIYYFLAFGFKWQLGDSDVLFIKNGTPRLPSPATPALAALNKQPAHWICLAFSYCYLFLLFCITALALCCTYSLQRNRLQNCLFFFSQGSVMGSDTGPFIQPTKFWRGPRQFHHTTASWVFSAPCAWQSQWLNATLFPSLAVMHCEYSALNDCQNCMQHLHSSVLASMAGNG